MYRCKSDDLKERLFSGEVLAVAIDERDVAVCVAKRRLFVVAELEAATPALLERVADFAEHVDDDAPMPWATSGGEVAASVRRRSDQA